MDTTTIALYSAGLLVLGFGVAYSALILLSPRPIPTRPSEQVYRSRASPSKALPLPSLFDEPSVDLTVVIPAYNETERLPAMLESTVAHLQSYSQPTQNGTAKSTSTTTSSTNGTNSSSTTRTRAPPPKRTYEILIVDDGSSDSTSSFALTLSQSHTFAKSEIRVVTLQKNLGKGGAVRHGMLHGRGRRLLMVDADGASRFEDLEGLWEALDGVEEKQRKEGREDRGCVAVGSRAHLVKTEAVVKRSFIRNFLMFSLHLILRIVGVGSIRDTQCGFKLFTRPAAQSIFPAQHLTTWIFDVELLLLATQMGIPVEEVPIEWHEVEGSKLNVMIDSLGMLRDLLVLRGNMIFGRWGGKVGKGSTTATATGGGGGKKKKV